MGRPLAPGAHCLSLDVSSAYSVNALGTFPDLCPPWVPRAAVTNCEKPGFLETTGISSPESLRIEVPKQGVHRAVLPLRFPRKNPSLPLPASGSGRESSATSLALAVSLQPLAPQSRGLLPSLCLQVQPHPSLIWPYPTLITSPKTLFPNKVTFGGSGWIYLLGATYST